MRRSSPTVGATTVLVGLLLCVSGFAVAAGADAGGAAAAAPTAKQQSPKEILIGTWKRTVAIDKAQVEGYLKRGGSLKGAVSRDKLLAELEKIVSEEVTMEFDADGGMAETTKLTDGKPRTLRYRWKVTAERPEGIELELAHTATKGKTDVTVVYRPTIAFQGRDRFIMRDQRYERKPLTAPVWDRVRPAADSSGPSPKSEPKPNQ